MVEWALVALPPTTLITALAFWFGYALTATRVSYMGIDVSILGFSTTDYLLRSVDALIVPAITLLVVWLLLLAADSVVWPAITLARNAKAAGYGAVVLALLGLTAIGLSIRFVYESLPPDVYLVPPLLLGGGSVWLAYALKILRQVRQVRDSPMKVSPSARKVQGILTAMVVISLFWGFTLYAGALGRGRAMEFEASLSQQPAVTVYSKNALNLSSPIVETAVVDTEVEYRFRYTKLRLVIRSNDKYFLLPEGWTREAGTVIVLQESPALRLEFQPGEP